MRWPSAVGFPSELTAGASSPQRPNANTRPGLAEQARTRPNGASRRWSGVSPTRGMFSSASPAEPKITGGLKHLLMDGQSPGPAYVDDAAVVPAEIGRHDPNPWGLCDTLGSVAARPRSRCALYPWQDDDGRNAFSGEDPRMTWGVVLRSNRSLPFFYPSGLCAVAAHSQRRVPRRLRGRSRGAAVVNPGPPPLAPACLHRVDQSPRGSD